MRPADRDVARDSVSEQRRSPVTERDEPLSRFAYKYPTHSHLSAAPAPSRPPRVAVRNLSAAPQFAQLSKCVSCGLQWTSKKTAKQKHTHIEQCAKKNGLSRDTVKFLVEKEISVLFPIQPTPSSHSTESAAGTLMDSFVPNGSAKKFKRQQIIPTLRSLPNTRESILDRARDILGPPESQPDQHPTQRFRQSALARCNMQQPKQPALLDIIRCIEEPPLTQPFRASVLHGGTMTPERPVESSLPPTWQTCGSLFAQDCVLPSDRLISWPHHKPTKRSASPSPPTGGHPRVVRRRFLQ